MVRPLSDNIGVSSRLSQDRNGRMAKGKSGCHHPFNCHLLTRLRGSASPRFGLYFYATFIGKGQVPELRGTTYRLGWFVCIECFMQQVAT